ncbi:sortase family protein [Clostridium sp. CAG:508]|nr:sortase family protein [Clostridium sp. CAG:508]
MNQILVTEKLYVTPELKRKKRIYKIELFLSVFLICLLFSYYIYAEYDRNKSEEVSKEILAEIKEQVDNTVKKDENDKIVVILEVPGTQEDNEDKTENQNNNQTKTNNTKIDTKTYTSKDGVKYTTEAILKIPKINIEYPVLSATSDALLFVSLNKYWGPQPNEVGNYCIVGHYYENGKMFGKLHKLKNGDKAELTDLSGNTLKYQVYNKYVVEPTDTRCTSQLTDGRKELTLITCTNGGKQRLVVKLRQV